MSTPKGSETVALRRVVKDRYGDVSPGPTLTTFRRCAVIPRQLGEDNDRGSVAIKGHQVYIPPQREEWGDQVAEADRVVKDSDQLHVRGEWTDIEGHPAEYVDLRGKPKGRIVTTHGEVVA